MGFGPPMGKLASPRLNAVLRSRSTKVAKSALPLVRPIWGWRRLSLEVILLSGQIGHDMKSLAYGSDFWYVSYLRSRRSSTMLTWGPSSIYPLWGTNFVGFKQGLNNRKTTTYLWWLTPNKVQFFDSGMKIFFSGGKLLQCARCNLHLSQTTEYKEVAKLHAYQGAEDRPCGASDAVLRNISVS